MSTTQQPHAVPSSRRSFLKHAAAAFAAAALAGPAARGLLAADAPAAGGDDGLGGLKLGIQSYSLRDRPLDKALDAMKNDLKLHYMEVYPNHLQAAAKLMGRKPAELKEIFQAANVNLTSYGVSGFSKDEKKNRELFDLAKAYGLKTISADPDDNKETFDLLDKLTEEYGVSIAIHPHGPGHKWGKVEQLKKAFDGRSNRIGLCADTGHLIRSGENPLDVIKLFKDRTHSLHLKDFKRLDPTKDKWEDVPAGDASLDVDGIVKYLIAEKWPGHIYIEYEGKEPVPAIQKSVARVKQAVTKANAK